MCAVRANAAATAAREVADVVVWEEFDCGCDDDVRNGDEGWNVGVGVMMSVGEVLYLGWIVVARANAKSAKGAAASGEKKFV